MGGGVYLRIQSWLLGEGMIGCVSSHTLEIGKLPLSNGEKMQLLGTITFDLMRLLVDPPPGFTLERRSLSWYGSRSKNCWQAPLRVRLTRARSMILYEASDPTVADLVLHAEFFPAVHLFH